MPEELLPRSSRPDNSQRRRFDWVTDRADGFAGCEYIYDEQGRLIAIDFQSRPHQRRTPSALP